MKNMQKRKKNNEANETQNYWNNLSNPIERSENKKGVKFTFNWKERMKNEMKQKKTYKIKNVRIYHDSKKIQNFMQNY